MTPGAPVPGDTDDDLTDALDVMRYIADQHPAASPQAPTRDLARALLIEFDRRGAQIDELRGLYDSREREVNEVRMRAGDDIDKLRAENVRLRTLLDAGDGPVLDGVHALALGSIARDIGLTSEASGARVALTVLDELARLRAALAERDAEITRLRELAGTWEIAALAAISERLDPDTARRVGDRMREIVAERSVAPAPAREQTPTDKETDRG